LENLFQARGAVIGPAVSTILQPIQGITVMCEDRVNNGRQ